MSGPLYAVYGASGCGRGIMPLARAITNAAGVARDRIVFIDDSPGARRINGHAVYSYEEFKTIVGRPRKVAIAIADGIVRARIADRLIGDGVKLWTVKADNAVVMDEVAIGDGALISPFVTITSNIRIGRCFHANIGSYVEHDCMIGDFVTFAPGVKCNGNVMIEDHAYIGAGAILKQGKPGAPLVIGRGAVVGMGAVVLKDVEAGTTVAGNPAERLEKR